MCKALAMVLLTATTCVITAFNFAANTSDMSSTMMIEKSANIIVGESPVEDEMVTVDLPPVEEVIEEPPLPEKDIELLAYVTMAEAEGESELGKRLVIDTILNRVDCSEFPNDISGVVYQKHQFTSMWNGRVNKVSINDYVKNLVTEEIKARTNSDVIYFRTKRYHKTGSPLFKEGHHYFSSL